MYNYVKIFKYRMNRPCCGWIQTTIKQGAITPLNPDWWGFEYTGRLFTVAVEYQEEPAPEYPDNWFDEVYS